MESFDIVVIGGGHAGIEASSIASQFKLKVALITMPDVKIGSAPCNPSIGGVGKGQVVRELDALGGVMGFLADKAGIQYRTLNESKGYAVRSTRVQIDKDLYPQYAEEYLKNLENLSIVKEKVESISRIMGNYIIETKNKNYQCKKIIVTVGTFLNGKLHLGANTRDGGRVNSESSTSMLNLFKQIKKVPLRFKTGTPARIRKDSVNYSKLEVQESDKSTQNFHILNDSFNRNTKQIDCYLTYTNEKTMEIIRENKEKSPMYNGQIKAVGARYCPSIEDKAYRYPDKNRHHVFVEPEGINAETMYPSGISSSLPEDIQQKFINSIEGLEEAVVQNYGYAVEYDVVDTTSLRRTLEYKDIPGLYFAGQVNGTSGYEEAAGQGFIAGVNAALAMSNKKELVLDRADSYIGVMIEDLVTNMRDEPYRLFTARSENRLYIREDNAFLRMCPYRTKLGLNQEIDIKLAAWIKIYKNLSVVLDKITVDTNDEIYNHLSTEPLNRRVNLSELLKLSIIDPVNLLKEIFVYYQISCPVTILQCLGISKKYEGYINRANKEHIKFAKLDKKRVYWEKLVDSKNISFECKQRISKLKPESFKDLRLIEGIRPATLAVVAGDAI